MILHQHHISCASFCLFPPPAPSRSALNQEWSCEGKAAAVCFFEEKTELLDMTYSEPWDSAKAGLVRWFFPGWRWASVTYPALLLFQVFQALSLLVCNMTYWNSRHLEKWSEISDYFSQTQNQKLLGTFLEYLWSLDFQPVFCFSAIHALQQDTGARRILVCWTGGKTILCVFILQHPR